MLYDVYFLYSYTDNTQTVNYYKYYLALILVLITKFEVFFLIIFIISMYQKYVTLRSLFLFILYILYKSIILYLKQNHLPLMINHIFSLLFYSENTNNANVIQYTIKQLSFNSGQFKTFTIAIK